MCNKQTEIDTAVEKETLHNYCIPFRLCCQGRLHHRRTFTSSNNVTIIQLIINTHIGLPSGKQYISFSFLLVILKVIYFTLYF